MIYKEYIAIVVFFDDFDFEAIEALDDKIGLIYIKMAQWFGITDFLYLLFLEDSISIFASIVNVVFVFLTKCLKKGNFI